MSNTRIRNRNYHPRCVVEGLEGRQLMSAAPLLSVGTPPPVMTRVVPASAVQAIDITQGPLAAAVAKYLKDNVAIGNQRSASVDVLTMVQVNGSWVLNGHYNVRCRQVWDSPFGKIVTYDHTFGGQFSYNLNTKTLTGDVFIGKVAGIDIRVPLSKLQDLLQIGKTSVTVDLTQSNLAAAVAKYLKDNMAIGNQRSASVDALTMVQVNGSWVLNGHYNVRCRQVWDSPFGKIVMYDHTFGGQFSYNLNTKTLTGDVFIGKVAGIDIRIPLVALQGVLQTFA